MGNDIIRDTIYREITDKIIRDFENGIVPWVRPWKSGAGLSLLSLPQNALTKRNYSGINILLLWSALDEKGFANSKWLTFKQALAMGGVVRKGESGTHVYFADKFVPDKEKQKAQDEGTDPASVHFLKRYTVFNVAQCDGLPEGLNVVREPLPECEIVPHAEALIAATGADFRIGGDEAFYVPSEDFIRIPHQTSYTDQINYYQIGRAHSFPTRRSSDLLLLFFFRHKLVGKINMGSTFTLANHPTHGKGLFEGQPFGIGKALFIKGSPQIGRAHV